MVTTLPQSGYCANTISTMWKIFAYKTSTIWKLKYKDNHISNLISKDSYTELWWAGMWHFDPNRPFKRQIDFTQNYPI